MRSLVKIGVPTGFGRKRMSGAFDLFSERLTYWRDGTRDTVTFEREALDSIVFA
jgi:hypothetical protein